MCVESYFAFLFTRIHITHSQFPNMKLQNIYFLFFSSFGYFTRILCLFISNNMCIYYIYKENILKHTEEKDEEEKKRQTNKHFWPQNELRLLSIISSL